MKKTILTIPVALLFSCGNQANAPEVKISPDTVKQDAVAVEEVKPQISNEIYGYYVGAFEAQDVKPNRTYFYANKINISIDSLADGQIKGHSVVAGNNRPFFGTYEEVNGVYKVVASEPGDDKYDGKFEFTLDPGRQIVEGTWTANNSKLEVSKRKYNLSKMVFEYNANNGLSETGLANISDHWASIADLNNETEFEALTMASVTFNASKDKLKKKDVENMFKDDLEFIRNAIYARHGYSFKNRKMRYIFDNEVDWYMPVTTDVRDVLTPLEKENIELIKRYEQHAAKYYDNFGR